MSMFASQAATSLALEAMSDVNDARIRVSGQRSPAKGFMKVLVRAADDRILGFTMLGSEAGEGMAAMQIAMMLSGTTYPIVRDAVITHLTFAEGLGPLLANVPARSSSVS